MPWISSRIRSVSQLANWISGLWQQSSDLQNSNFVMNYLTISHPNTSKVLTQHDTHVILSDSIPECITLDVKKIYILLAPQMTHYSEAAAQLVWPGEKLAGVYFPWNKHSQWKFKVGRWNFLWGWSRFRGYVSFLEGKLYTSVDTVV